MNKSVWDMVAGESVADIPKEEMTPEKVRSILEAMRKFLDEQETTKCCDVDLTARYD